jgi:hypothetical protein
LKKSIEVLTECGFIFCIQQRLKLRSGLGIWIVSNPRLNFSAQSGIHK